MIGDSEYQPLPFTMSGEPDEKHYLTKSLPKDWIARANIKSLVYEIIVGDVGAEFVDLYHAVRLLIVYGIEESEPNYNPNCDLDNNRQIFLYDAVILLSHYGDSWEP